MFKKENNFAFIDSNNLYQGLFKDLYHNNKKVYSGWKLDYKRFRIYLKDKYKIEKAFLFIGFVPGNQPLYTALQKSGFICVFKPTLELDDGSVKGNVDAEIVLHSMIEYDNYDQAIIISGDGDFYCLAQYLLSKNKLKKILVPNQRRYSFLLEGLNPPTKSILSFLSDLKNKLEYRK